MIVLAIFPQINFGIFYGIRLLMRLIDSGKNCCKKNHGTKKTTVTQYVDLYCGPEMFMFWKYSNVLNLTFVTLTHGIALPTLFPITLFGIVNNFFTERILLAYYYRQPPLLDNKLDNRAIETLKYSPILMLSMGYWYLGNRQMFFNEYSLVEEANDEVQDSGHHVFDLPLHTLPLLFAIPIVLFHEPLINFVTRNFQKFGWLSDFKNLRKFDNKELIVNENLGQFWQCLSGIDQKRWFTQEQYFRKHLKLSRLDDD